MRDVTSHHSAVRFDGDKAFKAYTTENIHIRVVYARIIFFEVFLRHMERISVFHRKFPYPYKAAAATRLVAEFSLNLINHKGQLVVTRNGVFRHMNRRFLVSHSEQHIFAASVLETHHFAADTVISARQFPQFARHHDGELDFLSVYFVHLVPYDVFDIKRHKLRGTCKRVYSVCHGLDITRPGKQNVT